MAEYTENPQNKQDNTPQQLGLFEKKVSKKLLTKWDYHLVGAPVIRWLGSELPKDVKTKTSWKCSLYHDVYVWEATYNDIQQRVGCPECAAKKAAFAKKIKHMPRKIRVGMGFPKVESDYHKIGKPRGIQWLGDELPKNTTTRTKWQCPEGHVWEARYNGMYRGHGCPDCANMVNGVKVSSQQEWLCDLVAGELNTYIEGYYVDITLFLDGINIACEYDGWHWHKDKLGEDAKRDADLIAAGWRVLRVKSNALLPNEQDVLNAIKRLLNGSNYEEIILADWGATINA